MNNENKEQLNKRPFIEIFLSGNNLRGLVDTGAAISAIDEKLFNQLKGPETFKNEKIPYHHEITAANGGRIMVVSQYKVTFDILGRGIPVEIYVVKNLTTKLILGMDFIQRGNVVINGANQTISVNGEVISRKFLGAKDEISEIQTAKVPNGRSLRRLDIPSYSLAKVFVKLDDDSNDETEKLALELEEDHHDLTVYSTISTYNSKTKGYAIMIANPTEAPITILKGTKICKLVNAKRTFYPPTINELNRGKETRNIKPLAEKERVEFLNKINLKCPPEYRKRYKDLFSKYHDVFSKDEYDLGWTDKVSHRIKLKHDQPIHTKQFRIPYPHQEILKEFVADMLDRKLIEVSRSRYNSPIFCVKKKNGSWRPVVDLRAINQATVEDFYAIRDIKSCIDEIGRERSTVFSSMDLSKGFFQQNLAEESRPYTSFTVPGLGSFQFTVSCFGSHGAPSSFSYLMTEVLRGKANLISFIDDVLAHTRDHERQLATLDVCFAQLRGYNLKLSPEKSTFGASETEYLGFKIMADGILPGTDKVRAVREFQPPSTIKQIRQFVGLASFFRDHIKDFSRISGYLTSLTRKTSDWKGGPLPKLAEESFYRIKNLLTSEPLIAYARNDIPFRLYCDASMGMIEKNGNKISGGLGVVLTQIHEDQKERVIGYASRKLKKHEENYPAFLLELLAVTFGCEHYHHYLYGQKRFSIFSDHKPLSKLNKVHTKTHGRLSENLLNYNYEIIYRKGEDQEAADFLSRNALDEMKGKALDFVNYTKAEIHNFQQHDPTCEDIRSYLRDETYELPPTNKTMIQRHRKRFVVDDDEILWWKESSNSTKLLIVPWEYTTDIISTAHDGLIGGHRDVEKTMDRIRRVYWWTTMTKDITEYVRCCKVCQHQKGPKEKSSLKHPLRPLEIPQKFNERVHADLMGPLKSCTENKYILVMSDSFTKWLELAPIPDKSAETVAKAMTERWLYRNSPMDVLVTDNGREFDNETMKLLCNNFGIKHRFTSPYHPQTNAQCERQNRTILSYLRNFVDKSTLDWEGKLPSCQYSFNSQRHQSTKFSPYYLRHFQDPTIPFRRLENPGRNYSENWANEALLTQAQVWSDVYENLTRAKGVQEKQYNKDAVEREFQDGDLVFLYDETTSVSQNPKLVNKWKGPYLILRMIGPTNAILKKSPRGKEFNIHVNRLKHAKELPEDYSRGYLRRTDDNAQLEPEATTSTSSKIRRKRRDNRSADSYDDLEPPMEETSSPKSTSEPDERKTTTETTGSDDVFRDDDDGWSSVDETFSSEEDDDDDDGDNPDPPGEISRHSGTYPKTSTPKESDEEQRSEADKREYDSTNTSDDHRRKRGRRESTKSPTRMPKRGHESTSSATSGRVLKKDRQDDATRDVSAEEDEIRDEEPQSPPEERPGASKRERARTPDHLKESHHPDKYNKKTWTQFRQPPRGKHRLSGDLGRSVTEDEPITHRTRARRDLREEGEQRLPTRPLEYKKYTYKDDKKSHE